MDRINIFNVIKKQLIQMMCDLKEFESVTSKNKVYIEIVLNLIDNFENESFLDLAKDLNEFLVKEINEENYKEILIDLIKEIKFIKIKDNLSFLSDLKQNETTILITHLKVLFAYILKFNNEK